MALRRPTLRLELDDGTEHVVEILHADQLRAELEGPRHGIPADPSAMPLHTTTLWVWSAMVRTAATADKFQTFRSRIVRMDRVPEEAATPPDVPMGPTQQDQD